MVDSNTVIEGTVKFRDGKKWKSRWCVMRKLSPVADCLHLQLYRDSKDRYKQGHTKASLSLQHFLAIETGFTLDKESNTIAIICQDVTVILAFDTRERLMQWQVKIVNNLGEDQPFLIQITSAPPRAKISPGPARLHVQEQRFCLTSGVPPRLLGFWDISQLRRYGVVEGRFVFEGGSRCGKGEGVHVCVTDQAEEITKVFQMAAQGKVANRRRAVTRNMSVIDSPRRQVHSRASDVDSLQQSFMHNQTMSSDFSGDDFPCPCSRLHRDSSSPFWLSTETSAAGLHGGDLDSNYGCGDAMSISDYQQHHQHLLHHQHHLQHHPHQHQHGEAWPSSMVSSSPAGRTASSSSAAMERCSSCISKLGAASMSRSSTSTTSYPNHNPAAAAGGIPFNPAWTMDVVGAAAAAACPHHPKVALLRQQGRSEAAGQAASYENYDVPKSLLGSVQAQEPKEETRSLLSTSATEEYYDTPKSIKDSLASTTEMEITTNQYGNYDVPPSVKTLRKPCGCVIKLSKKSVLVTSLVETTKLVMEHEDPSENAPVNCPCQKVMCWAENLMLLPYCRRGNGIENTGVPIQKVKLSGEGKMPVVNTSGEIAIYATVDKSKKNSRKHLPTCSQGPCACPRVTAEDADENSSQSNYVNVDIEAESSKCPTAGEQQTGGDDFFQMDTNYENIDFAQSLEYYENAKDVLMRAGMNQDAPECGAAGTTCSQKCEESSGQYATHYGTHEIMVCSKCGHECHAFLSGPMGTGSDGDCRISALTESAEAASANAQDDYLMMEPAKNGSSASSAESAGRNHPGYLPMSPVPSGSTAAKNDLIKRAHQRGMCNLSSEKSASIPSLASPITQSTDKCCKRSELEYHRVPGAAMMMSPYLKQRLAESDERAHQVVCRKRSSSADSRNPEALEDLNSVMQSKMSPAPVRRVCANAMFHKCDPKTEMISTTEAEVSSACDVHKETPQANGAAPRQKEDTVVTTSQPGSSDESMSSSRRPSINNCELPISEQPKGAHSAVPASVHIRRSSSVPCKSGNNRDSSSSNDSGVSTGSLKQGGGDFSEFELPLTTSVSAKKHQYSIARHPGYVTNCLHSSLPRRSKSVDPLRDITFQFQKIKVPAKSSSAEAEVPVCPKARGFQSPGGESAVVAPYMDSRSTSSGTSDMSDYIETLSVSSHSSSDVQDALLLGRQATTTLRPRSGKEYQLIDRSILDGDMKGDKAGHPLRTIGGQYANITPVPEKSESPSPGYMSGSPGQERDDQPLILHNFAAK